MLLPRLVPRLSCLQALKYRRQFLTLASTGCTRFVLNRPAWSLESELKQMGLVYW